MFSATLKFTVLYFQQYEIMAQTLQRPTPSYLNSLSAIQTWGRLVCLCLSEHVDRTLATKHITHSKGISGVGEVCVGRVYIIRDEVLSSSFRRSLTFL